MPADVVVVASARFQFYQSFDLVQFGKFIARGENVDCRHGTDQSFPLADADPLHGRCRSRVARGNVLAGHETKHELG